MYDDETVATMLIEELRQRIANARQHNESADAEREWPL